MSWTARAEAFRELHDASAPLLLPSVDAVLSVADLRELGFAAVELRRPQPAAELPATFAVELPPSPDAVGARARELVDLGGVGLTLDDEGGALELQCARVRAASALGLIVTARSHVHREGGALDESLQRLLRLGDAGASVLEAPGLRRAEDIRRVAETVQRPINVTLGLGGVPPSLEVLGQLGVARVSTGRVLEVLAPDAARRAAREMLDHGTFEFLVELE